MASKKTNIAVDDQHIDPIVSASAQTFASLVPPSMGNPLSAGSVTDDRQPGFHGLGTPGDTIIVRDNGIVIGQTDVAADGTWTCTPSTDLLEGLHAITVVARAPSGTESAPSAPFNFEIDVTPPDASKLFITGVMDDVGSVTGNVMSGATTDDTRPLLSGASSGVPGHTVTVMVTDATGMRELGQAVTALSEGAHSVTAAHTDAAGNMGAQSPAFALSVDTVPPGAPTIVSVYDDVGVTGNVASGSTTDDARPDFKGKAEANSTVKVYDGNTLLGTVVASASGDWTFTPTTALSNAAHSITVTATDVAGNTSAPSAAFDFTVDPVPTQTATLSAMGKDSGFSGVDYLTNDGSAGRLMQGKLSAALDAGQTLQVSTDGGKTWKTAFISGTQWSAQDDSGHTGNWTVQTRVMGAGGDVGVVKSQGITLDVTAPAAPTSVVVNGLDLTVSFNKVGMNAGDRIHVAVGSSRFEYFLTAADVSAGSVKITPPIDLYAANTVVCIVDHAGNASVGIASAAKLSTGFENIVGVPVGERGAIVPGTVVLSDGFLISVKSGSGSYWAYSVGDGSIGPLIGVETHSVLEIKLTAISSSVSFDYFGVNNPTGNSINFYDENGVLLKSLVMQLLNQKIEYAAPAGKGVARIEFVTGDEVAGSGIDNLVIVPRSDLINPANDIVATQGSYIGGDANDVFSLASVLALNSPLVSVKGGAGLDTLKLTGANQTLDLTALAGKLSSIEVIDLTGTGNNTLKLSLADVMENGGMNQFVADGRVQMLVKGNAGDKVTLTDLLSNGVDAGDWVKKANVTVSGVVYEVYQHSGFGAELLVQQGVAVTLQNTAATFSSTALEVDADALAHSGYGTDVLAHATQAFTENDDTLIARLGFADRLAGGAGNDTITNVGTADVAHGGAGDDVIRINSGDFERVDGGLGIDTLVMDGKAMHIDLSALGMKVQGFEKFDLGAGGNTLALHASDVLAGGLRDMVTADGKVQMLVNGANGDVNLLGGNDDWTQGDSTSVSGVTYHVYTNLAGTAELLVEDKVHVTIL